MWIYIAASTLAWHYWHLVSRQLFSSWSFLRFWSIQSISDISSTGNTQISTTVQKDICTFLWINQQEAVICKLQAGSKAGGEGDGQVRLWRQRPRRLAVQERRTSHCCLKGAVFTLCVKFIIIKMPRSREQWWIISVKIIFIICNLWSISVKLIAVICNQWLISVEMIVIICTEW